MKVIFTLPNFYAYQEINRRLIILWQHRPDYFNYDNIGLNHEEGNFPRFYHSGHTCNTFRFANYDIIKDATIISNAAIVLDCSNPLIEDNDKFDTGLNLALKLMDNGEVGVLISHPFMLEYIKSNYKYYHFIASEHYHIFDNQYSNNEDLSRIRFFINDTSYSNIDKSKVELIVNNHCLTCEKRPDCILQDWQGFLQFKHQRPFMTCNKVSTYCAPVELIQQKIKEGYRHFCFNSQYLDENDFTKLIELYLNVFIKPEYQDSADLILRGIKYVYD